MAPAKVKRVDVAASFSEAVEGAQELSRNVCISAHICTSMEGHILYVTICICICILCLNKATASLTSNLLQNVTYACICLQICVPTCLWPSPYGGELGLRFWLAYPRNSALLGTLQRLQMPLSYDPMTQNWVAVKELNSNHHNRDIR